MSGISTNNGPQITLPVADPTAFNGKQDLLVSVDANGNAVLYAAGTNPPVGTFAGRNFPQDKSILVRSLSGGGTLRCIQNAALATGTAVAADPATGRVIADASGKLGLGIKIAPVGAGAAGDVIEILPVPFLAA